MRFLATALTIVLAWPVLAAERTEAKKTAAAFAELAGEWKAVETEVDGKKMDPKELADYRLVFTGNDCAIHSGKRVVQCRVVVDAGESPHSIDLTRAHDNVTSAGIYEVKEGRLWVLLGTNGGKRPTEFKTKTGTDEVLRVYERVKPQPEVPKGIGEQSDAADSR